MAKTIKIFGERNTSTNALRSLIKENAQSYVAPGIAKELDPGFKQRLKTAKKWKVPGFFRERMIDRVFDGRGPLEAWKHTAPNFQDISAFSECHVIFCVRHPASWLLGLYKRPYHIYGRPAANFGEFLNKRWKTAKRERLASITTDAITLYNLKMVAYENFQRRLYDADVSYSIVRHEDFAVDQAAVFATLVPRLLDPKLEPTLLDASTKDHGKNRDYYKEFYGKQLWRSEIDSESMARINDEIDWQGLTSVDYRPI